MFQHEYQIDSNLGRVKGNVAKMVSMGAPEVEIDEYISTEGYSVNDVKNYTGNPTRKVNSGESALRGGLQGLTANFSDEISGALGAAGAYAYDKITGKGLFDDQSFSDMYKEGRDIDRKFNQEAQEENPNTYMAAGLTGAVLSPVNKLAGVGNIGKAGTLGQKAIQGAKFGAKTGGLFGAGASEEEGLSALPDAAIGAGFGAAVGAAAPYAMAGASKVGNAIKKGAGEIKTLVRGREADQILANKLANQNLSKITKRLEQGDDSVWLPDVAGDEMKGLLRLVGKTGNAKDIVSGALERRSAGAVSRVTKALAKDVSNVDAYFGSLDDIAKARSLAAKPLYDQSYKAGKTLKMSKTLKAIVNDQRVVDAINKAKSEYGVSAETKVNSIEALDGAKKVLDDIIGEAMRKGKNQLAGSYLKLKGKLTNYLDDTIPSYKQARQIFSDFSSLENAQKEGVNFFKRTPEELKIYIKDLTAGEKNAFKIGVREALQKTVSKTSDGADPAKRIFGNTYKRAQLRTIFDNKTEFWNFAKKMQNEIQGAKTKFRALGGSRTDINLAEDKNLLTDTLEASAQGKAGLLNKALQKITDNLETRYIGITEKNAIKLAKILTNKQLSLEALKRLQAKNTANTVVKGSGQQALFKKALKEYYPQLFVTGSVQTNLTE